MKCKRNTENLSILCFPDLSFNKKMTDNNRKCFICNRDDMPVVSLKCQKCNVDLCVCTECNNNFGRGAAFCIDHSMISIPVAIRNRECFLCNRWNMSYVSLNCLVCNVALYACVECNNNFGRGAAFCINHTTISIPVDVRSKEEKETERVEKELEELKAKGHKCLCLMESYPPQLGWCQKEPCAELNKKIPAPTAIEDSIVVSRTLEIRHDPLVLDRKWAEEETRRVEKELEELKAKGHKCLCLMETYPPKLGWCCKEPCLRLLSSSLALSN